jgi:hypothetical protein
MDPHGAAFGIRLPDAGATKTVGGGRVTHRIALRSPKDVDAEVKHWLREAYDHDA